jgi:hypothetical protein
MEGSRQRASRAGEASLPPPPPMQSPTLAVWRVPTSDVRRARWPALAILLVVFGSLPLLGGDPDGVDWTVAFGLAILVWLLTGWAYKRKAVAVGRDWLSVSLARGDEWVRTDRLAKFKWDSNGHFSLRDHDQRVAVVNPELLRENPEVFRIFVAAVRLSVAGGLALDEGLRDELGLDPSPD